MVTMRQEEQEGSRRQEEQGGSRRSREAAGRQQEAGYACSFDGDAMARASY